MDPKKREVEGDYAKRKIYAFTKTIILHSEVVDNSPVDKYCQKDLRKSLIV